MSESNLQNAASYIAENVVSDAAQEIIEFSGLFDASFATDILELSEQLKTNPGLYFIDISLQQLITPTQILYLQNAYNANLNGKQQFLVKAVSNRLFSTQIIIPYLNKISNSVLLSHLQEIINPFGPEADAILQIDDSFSLPISQNISIFGINVNILNNVNTLLKSSNISNDFPTISRLKLAILDFQNLEEDKNAFDILNVFIKEYNLLESDLNDFKILYSIYSGEESLTIPVPKGSESNIPNIPGLVQLESIQNIFNKLQHITFRNLSFSEFNICVAMFNRLSENNQITSEQTDAYAFLTNATAQPLRGQLSFHNYLNLNSVLDSSNKYTDEFVHAFVILNTSPTLTFPVHLNFNMLLNSETFYLLLQYIQGPFSGYVNTVGIQTILNDLINLDFSSDTLTNLLTNLLPTPIQIFYSKGQDLKMENAFNLNFTPQSIVLGIYSAQRLESMMMMVRPPTIPVTVNNGQQSGVDRGFSAFKGNITFKSYLEYAMTSSEGIDISQLSLGNPACLLEDCDVLLFDNTYKNIKEIKREDVLLGFFTKTPQKIKKIYQTTVCPKMLENDNVPFLIKKNAFRDNVPNNSMHLSGHHRIVFPTSENTYVGVQTSKVAVENKNVIEEKDTANVVVYYHLILQNTDEAIVVNGLPVESCGKDE